MKELPDPNQDALTWAALVLNNAAEENSGFGGKTTRDYVKRLRATSKRLRQMAGQRWIPVGERLPVDIHHGYCLVTDGENVGTANYSTTANKFDHCIDRDYWTPTHWMPLPEPPAR